MEQKKAIGLFSIPVLVAALGYFVDIYDLLLFSMVRNVSLESLGVTGDKGLSIGQDIISVQMLGLLIGGIFWGVLGDKKGRLSVLFGSILLYSVANIANGMVHTVQQYELCRFIAGIGLAGELGAGITLVSELISKELRGIATSMVAGIGLTGAVVAYFISQAFDWRVCYYIGGGLGLGLLALRVSVFESGLYDKMKDDKEVRKGDFFLFFTKRKRATKYLLAILIGLPTWYVIGLLITFSDKFGKEFGIQEIIMPGKAVMYAYIAISIADVLIGIVSHALRSRKKALYIFYAITIVGIVLYFRQYNGTAAGMYGICALMGFGTGFWALFVTMAAEHFGTNLRATAATTVPNMVRGSLPIILFLFKWLQTKGFSFIDAGVIAGVIVMVISTIAVFLTEETFGKDLNFIED